VHTNDCSIVVFLSILSDPPVATGISVLSFFLIPEEKENDGRENDEIFLPNMKIVAVITKTMANISISVVLLLFFISI
ncbi:MAG: hypothetical protein IKF80_07205, partial [Erysipelotrichaceae bacterium]|nr:hypothetical protein [Erysipelotrichaceae bacterium]